MTKIKANKLCYLICLLILFCLANQVQAFEISGEVVNEFNYTRGEKLNQFGDVEDIDRIDNIPKLNLGLSGLLGTYQYRVDLKLDGTDFSTKLERASISTFLGPTFIELGKKDWGWGEGFSSSPTYPFQTNRTYLGGELNLFYKGYDLDLGIASNEANNNLSASWFRFSSLLASSDYSLVLSYLNDDSEVELNAKEGKEQGVNLGVDYSKDFLNDLLLHSSLNLRYWLSEDDLETEYLLGITYYTENDKLLIGEYYRKLDDYLMLSLRDRDSSNNWDWNLNYTINLVDFGQRRSFAFSYLGVDDLDTEIELVNYGGFEDWELSFKIKMAIF